MTIDSKPSTGDMAATEQLYEYGYLHADPHESAERVKNEVADIIHKHKTPAERVAEELLSASKAAIQSGPMKIEPSPRPFTSIEMLPDNTMIDFRMSAASYKKIIVAIAKAEGKE